MVDVAVVTSADAARTGLRRAALLILLKVTKWSLRLGALVKSGKPQLQRGGERCNITASGAHEMIMWINLITWKKQVQGAASKARNGRFLELQGPSRQAFAGIQETQNDTRLINMSSRTRLFSDKITMILRIYFDAL